MIYLLNKSQAVIKAYSVNNTVEAKVTQGINQANQLTLSVPLQDRFDSNIFFALIPTEDKNDYLLFKLNDESVENDRITYTGIDAAYDELKGYAYIQEIRPVKRTAKEILDRILENTRWEVGYIDATAPIDTSFYYQSVLECIQQVVQLFNVEVTFTYSYNTKTHEITARRVNIYKQQGRRTGKRFEYGSNLLTVTREEDSQNIVTALVGRGKGEEKYDDDTGEATGGYGRRINFKDVVWSKANGDPADKPAGQEFVENKEATKIFGYDDGTPRTGIVVFEDIEDPVELLNATWASLVASCRPKVGFKASVTDTGDLRLGDTIAIIRHELGIEYFTRVFKVVRDLKDEHNNTVEMGDDLSGRSLTSYVSDVSNVANQAVQDANQAAVSAGSKNKNFYSYTKPASASEGDNLFLNLGNGDFEYWVWHNGQWEFIQSTQDLKIVEQNVKQAQDDVKKNSNEIEKSKADFNKSISDLDQSVVRMSDSLEGLNTSVANNKNEISNLKQTAQGIQTKVNDNSGKLTTLTQTVDGVKITAQSGLDKATSLSQTVEGLQTKVENGADKSEVQQLKDQLNMKVSKGDVVGQLNIEAGRTLIQNKKILLDAESVVFGGKAFIPDAAITNISADKINAGTLDAGKINVININADNITAGLLKGPNGEFDLTTGRLSAWNSLGRVSVWNGEIEFEHKLYGIMSHTGSIVTNSEDSKLDGAISVKGDRGVLLSTKDFTTNWWSDMGFPWGTDPKNYVSGAGVLLFDNNVTVSGGSVNDNNTAALVAGVVPSTNLGNIYGSRAQPGVYVYGRDEANKDDSFVDIKGPAAIKLMTTNANISIGNTNGLGTRDSDIQIFSQSYINITSNQQINLNGSTTVWGSFGVVGNKNAVVPTSKGMTAISAYETAEYYFGDLGKAKTDDNGQVLIQLDPLFLETVNTSVPYHVFVSPYGNANVWVEQMDRGSFVVKSSKPNVEFSWEIKAKRLGYEDTRLEVTQKEIPKELIPEYKKKGIL